MVLQSKRTRRPLEPKSLCLLSQRGRRAGCATRTVRKGGLVAIRAEKQAEKQDNQQKTRSFRRFAVGPEGLTDEHGGPVAQQPADLASKRRRPTVDVLEGQGPAAKPQASGYECADAPNTSLTMRHSCESSHPLQRKLTW